MELEQKLYNQDAEQSLLGSTLINNDFINRFDDIFEAKHFYFEEHKIIFNKIIELRQNNMVSNVITIKNIFETNPFLQEIGGISYLTKLLEMATGIFDIRDYALTIIDLWRKRELLNSINEISSTINDDSTDNLLTKLDDSLRKIDDSISTLQVFNGEDTLEEWSAKANNNQTSLPIPSNLRNLDEMLNGGFHKEGLYVFGAASGCGKTFFAQNIIINALKLNYGAFFASMEMPKRKIMSRFLSILSGVNSFRVLIGKIYNYEEQNFNYALELWKSYQKNFFIVEKISMSPKDIEIALKKVLRKSKIELLVIDYAQIMKLRDAKNINEASLIKENVNALAKIAQKYKIAILLLSQLTKDKISGKVGLGSLKGSGGLYEDADCVIAMWNNEENQVDSKIKNLQMEVLKNRDGMTGGLSLVFNGDFGEFKQGGL